jgi:hypothetical protein
MLQNMKVLKKKIKEVFPPASSILDQFLFSDTENRACLGVAQRERPHLTHAEEHVSATACVLSPGKLLPSSELE